MQIPRDLSVRILGMNCPSLEYPKSRWKGIGAAWESGSCPCPWMGWNCWDLRGSDQWDLLWSSSSNPWSFQWVHIVPKSKLASHKTLLEAKNPPKPPLKLPRYSLQIPKIHGGATAALPHPTPFPEWILELNFGHPQPNSAKVAPWGLEFPKKSELTQEGRILLYSQNSCLQFPAEFHGFEAALPIPA